MRAQQLAVPGLLSAGAFVLMATVQFPVLPQAPYLRYDPGDAVAVLAGILYGPGPAVAVVFVKDLLYLLSGLEGPSDPWRTSWRRPPSPLLPRGSTTVAGQPFLRAWCARRWWGWPRGCWS